MLTVRLPKSEKAKSKAIEVKVAQDPCVNLGIGSVREGVFLTLHARCFPHHVLSIHADKEEPRHGNDTSHGCEERPHKQSLSGLIVKRVRERRGEERTFLADVLLDRRVDVAVPQRVCRKSTRYGG